MVIVIGSASIGYGIISATPQNVGSQWCPLQRGSTVPLLKMLVPNGVRYRGVPQCYSSKCWFPMVSATEGFHSATPQNVGSQWCPLQRGSTVLLLKMLVPNGVRYRGVPQCHSSKCWFPSLLAELLSCALALRIVQYSVGVATTDSISLKNISVSQFAVQGQSGCCHGYHLPRREFSQRVVWHC